MFVSREPERGAPIAASARPASSRRRCLSDAAWILDLTQHLARCTRLIRRILADRTAGYELSEIEFQLLWSFQSLESHRPSQNELAQLLGISPAQISNLVEQLRKRGWIVGQRSQTDRRRQVWELTDAGLELCRLVAETLNADCAAVLPRFHHEDSDAVIADIERLATVLAALCDDQPVASDDASTRRTSLPPAEAA